MRHPFMEALTAGLTGAGLTVLRYQFPYMELGQKRPDPQPVLLATVQAALALGERLAAGQPLFAAGKSMGGRMASLALAEEPVPAVRGLVFFGFPLHQAGKPSLSRAAHLSRLKVPMLFLQGTRDTLADLELIRKVAGGLGERATLAVMDGADHGFAVPKRSGTTGEAVMAQLVAETEAFCRRLARP
jgi:predicted alpha/beta-hydrolase family hydrolase